MFSKNHNLHFSNTMTNMNPTKTKRRPKNTSKTPQTKTASEEKTTETKKFPRKRSETHLIFSKTHNQLPFIFTTNENPTKTQWRPQNTSETPQTRTGSNPKTKENPKSHRSTPKVPLNLPDVLQNPQFTLFHHDDQHEPI